MKKVGILVLLIAVFFVGFGISRYFFNSTYDVVKPNWIRTDTMAFTIEATDVTCRHLTISVLGFFSESMASELLNFPQKYLNLYKKIEIKTKPPVDLVRIDENQHPFGYFAHSHSQRFAIHPPLKVGDKLYAKVFVTFSNFVNIPRPVPFALELHIEECP